MERESNPSTQSSQPLLCRNGCGFFGGVETEGFCSKCYRDHVVIKQQRAMTPSQTIVDRPDETNEDVSTSLLGDSSSVQERVSDPTPTSTASSSDLKQRTPKRNRCSVCRKKVGLTGFGCRCGGLYCSVHRYSDKHDCSFDYKKAGREEIQRNNPIVVAPKVQKL